LGHQEIEGSVSAAVEPVGVVQLARHIHAQADQYVMRLEECAPIVVEQQAVVWRVCRTVCSARR
jgi:hypothetical protein